MGLSQDCLNRPMTLAFSGQYLYCLELSFSSNHYSVNKGRGLLFGSFSCSRAFVEMKFAAVYRASIRYVPDLVFLTHTPLLTCSKD